MEAIKTNGFAELSYDELNINNGGAILTGTVTIFGIKISKAVLAATFGGGATLGGTGAATYLGNK